MSINNNLNKYRFENCAESSYTSLKIDKENIEPEQDEHRNVLKNSFKFTPRFLNKSYDHWAPTRRDSCSLSSKLSKDRMARDSYHNLKRKALKRKVSLRSRQHLIPLSNELQKERGEIGECSTTPNPSINTVAIEPSPSTISAMSCKSVRQIIRQEIQNHLVGLKLSERFIKKSEKMSSNKNNKTYKKLPNTSTHSNAITSIFNRNDNVEIVVNPDQASLVTNPESDDKSNIIEMKLIESEAQSDSPESDTGDLQSDKISLPFESEKSASQKNFRIALQMQIEKWKEQLLKLKESTEIIEHIAFNKHFVHQNKMMHNTNEFSNHSTEISLVTRQPESLLSASLKVLHSQLEHEDDILGTPNSSLTSNDLHQPTFSCYAKMNEIDHRLSDVELRMASIHKILQVVRQQQYTELKVRKTDGKPKKRSKAARSSKIPTSIQQLRQTVGDCKLESQHSSNHSAEMIRSDPPLTSSGSTMSMSDLNPYDENYYEWRQYCMNLLHYKKSERTIELNRRPTLNIMKPPILKYFESTENKYRIRVKKPFFIVTPSRTKTFCE